MCSPNCDQTCPRRESVVLPRVRSGTSSVVALHVVQSSCNVPVARACPHACLPRTQLARPNSLQLGTVHPRFCKLHGEDTTNAHARGGGGAAEARSFF